MKNKRVIITTAAIIAAVAVISGIALFLIAPLLGENGQGKQVSEKSGAEILKTAGSDFRGKFGNIMSISAASGTLADDVPAQIEKIGGSIDIEEAVINGKDYTEGGVLHYELSDLLDNSNILDNEIVSAAEKIDEETIKQYQKVAEKLSGYMINAAETVVDGSLYEKQEGTVQLSIGDETVAAQAYKVTIPVSVIVSSTEAAIDNIFNDADIAPYITMLKAAGLKLDRDEMKNAIGGQLNIESIYFTMYVKDEKLCGLYTDGTWYDKESKDKAEYLFIDNKFAFNINIDDYKGNRCKFKGNGKLEPNI